MGWAATVWAAGTRSPRRSDAAIGSPVRVRRPIEARRRCGAEHQVIEDSPDDTPENPYARRPPDRRRCHVRCPGPIRARGKRPGTADVLVVSNNWAGTADLVDPHTFKRLKRINVIPDRSGGSPRSRPTRRRQIYYDNIRDAVGEGNDQYVDDGFTSPDGRTVYFSRPSFADVVAIDLQDRPDPLAHEVDGYRADHMAISKDGRRLLVSASTANVVDVDRHAHRPDHGADPVGRLTAREQLLPRRVADLPRQHRHRLHATPTTLAGRHQGQARLRGHRRAHATRCSSRSTWGRSSPRPATRT